MSLRPGASVSVPMWKLRRWLPTALVTALGLGGPSTWVLAQPATADWQHVAFQPPVALARAVKVEDKKPTEPKKAEEPKKDPLAAERTIGVNFDGAQWQEVLDWYGKESGLILNTTVKPTGSVTIKPGKDRKFTLGEVTDLLNESMVLQKFILIRYNTTFTIWPVDEKLDTTLLPAVVPSELIRRGKTELVKCVVGPLKTLSAADIRPEVEAMLTPFGKAQLFERSNSFQITDKAGNILRIKELLKEIEETGDAGTLTHVCKYMKARQIAGHLKDLLKDNATTVDSPMAAPAYPSPYGGYPQFGQPGFDPRGRDRGQGGNDPRAGGSSTPRNKSVQIAVDDDSNTVIITAPEDKIGQAKKIIEDLDKPTPGQQPLLITPPVLKTYSVPAGTAEATAKAITERYSWIRVTAIAASNQIMVVASADDHGKVSNVLTGGNPTGPAGEGVSRVIPINSSDPKELAAILSKKFPSSTAGGPLIESQPGGIFFSGTAEQYAEAKKLIEAFEGPSGFDPKNPRIQFTLEGGNAGILAEALGNAMKGMNKNPVIIQNFLSSPGGVPPKTPGSTVPPASGVPAMPPPAPLPSEKKSALPTGPRDPRYVLAQLVDPEAKKDLKPVIIRVIGNKLTIESEDPAALQLINDLLRLYVQQGTKVDENLFEVIRLKTVSAEDAAKVVSEIFNGPTAAAAAGGRPGGGGGGFNPLNLIGGLLGGGAPSGTPEKGRVRVVAEKSSNSLIVVKSSPLDLLAMRKLLANVIDSGETDSDAIQKTYVIKLKNTHASEMAATVKELYKPLTTATGGGGGGPANPFAFIAGGQQQGGNQQRPPALSVSTDDRTNSLALLCTKTLYDEIKQFVESTDNAAASESTEVVRIEPIKGVDPTLLQQMVDAMQGKDPNLQQRGLGGLGGNNNRGGGQQPGGGGFPGLGGGGFPGLGGGGFPGLGGGAFPGMGGGNRGGGNVGGGGGNRGGGGGGNRGGGGARPGGGGRKADFETEGPANFDHRDMDVPSAKISTIFDPETDTGDNGSISANHIAIPSARRPLSSVLPVGWQQPGGPSPMLPPKALPDGRPGAGVSVTAPSGTVTAIPLTEAGVIVIRTTNPRDMEIVLELIEFIRKQAEGTEPELRLVPLKYQDSSTVAGTLNSIFARVQVGQGGNVVPQAARQVNVGALLTAGSGAPSSTQNVYCVAMPRFNALLIAGPKGRFADIIKEVERIDQPNDPAVQVKSFQLKKASSQVIALQLRQLYSQRYPAEGPPNNQFRINFDLSSNSVLVAASPADMKDIAELIEKLDTMTSKALNDLRIFALKNAYADELASVLIQTLTANVLSPLAQSTQPWYTQTVTGANIGGQGGILALLGGGQQPGGGLGGVQGGGLQGGGLQQAFQQAGGQGGANLLGTGGVNLTPTIANLGSASGGGLATKTSALRFYSTRDGQVVETGFLEDVHIIPNTRTNALLVAAKPETMKLIEKLIENLDTVAAARSYINIFQLKTADATLTSLLLQQLFTGQNRTTLTPGAGGGGAAGQATAGTAQGSARPLLTVFGDVSPGAQLIDLRITVDDRTNSLIVAGSLNDLETIRSVIARLESADTQARHSDVYKLRNAAAADVATALTNFITASLAIYTTAQFNSAYLQLQRNVVIVAEPVSNTIMISATPQYFSEMKRIIERIDAQPPQVVIQVLIADVQLTNNEEMGVEFGVQSPLIFQRGASLNFNTTSALPTGAVGTGIVGFQGLGNLGVGRASTTGQSGGGLVFSAQSESFNLLMRALKAQGRITILSRPQLHVTDNQTGYINVGQNFPTPTNSTLTATGATQTGVQYVPVGITMRVTPRINPDGKVLMRVEPQVSSVAPSTISVGPGVNAPIFNQQTVETTVLAADGETIVIGGLISKQDTRSELGIPFFKDIPYVGALFRYRTEIQQRREVIFIMTPHIVRTEYDAARILAEESRRINWCLPDVEKIHGHGLEVMGPASQGANPVPFGGTMPGAIPPGQLPAGFGPGFVPPSTLPGPGLDVGPGYFYPQGAALPGLPGGPVPVNPPLPGQPNVSIPGLPPGVYLPEIPMSSAKPAGSFQPILPTSGVPILMPNGTITQASAVVHPGATPYVMMPAGGPPIITLPAAGPLQPTKNGFMMAYPAQEVPAGESKAPRGKEERPWGVFNK